MYLKETGGMEVYTSLDGIGYDRKPTNEIPQIKRRTSGRWMKVGVKELARMVGKCGHTIVPGHMQGGMKADNCTAMQLFVLDFDEGATFEEILDRCRRLGVSITFAYHTFSSTQEKDKFRVVFAYESVLKDIFVIKLILAMLHRIFPECDQSCKNLDRVFLGGKGVIYLDENARMNLVQLLFPFWQSVDVVGNSKRNIASFFKKQKVMLVNGSPAIGWERELEEWKKNDEIVDSTIIHTIAESTDSSFFILESKNGVGLHQNDTCRKKIRKLGITGDVACRLLDDFNNGIYLSYDARFALCTNLMCINGGRKHFLDILGKYYKKGEDVRWKTCMHYMRDYHPKNCSEGFCPYYKECENGGNIVNTLSMDRRVYREWEGEKTYSLEEARKCLKENIEEAYGSIRQGIHLIKAQTGLGKTYSYIQMIKEHPEGKFLIALPTNILKEQVAKGILAQLGKDVFMTVSVRENLLLPWEVREEIMQAHQQGFHNRTKKIISEYCKSIKDVRDKLAVVEECQRILDGVKAIKGERVIVTTHAFMENLPEEFLKQYTIIIDEDILMLQIMNRSSSIHESCLRNLLRLGNLEYARIAGEMLGAREGEYRRIGGSPHAKPFTSEELGEAGMSEDDNINDIASAEAFVKMDGKVKYFCPKKLPKLKYIVLSATLNQEIYGAYFKGEMDVWTYQEKKAAYKGKLIQYTYYSLGRSSLGKNMEEVIRFLQQLVGYHAPGIPDLITFMNMERDLQEAIGGQGGILHFGNTCGINSLSGHNIMVVGTPYKVEEAYKLVACYLGADVNREADRYPRPRRVSYNGYSFLITTYDEPLLRELQLYSIESELEQCVGRARLLNNECTVYVLSAFPCQQAELHMRDYLKED